MDDQLEKLHQLLASQRHHQTRSSELPARQQIRGVDSPQDMLDTLEHLLDSCQQETQARQAAEAALTRANQYIDALFNAVGNAIVILDKNHIIQHWNQAAEDLFGYLAEEAVGRNYIKHFVPPAFQDETAWRITTVFEMPHAKEPLESESLHFDGSSVAMLWNFSRLQSSSGRDEQVVLVGQDISEIRRTQTQLQQLAHYDVLTGAANRRLFEDRCTQALKHCARHQQEMALIGLDIDFFKRINDSLGHDVGDALLVEIVKRLKNSVREEDTIARLGGDEFAVLLTNVSGPAGAEKVARNIMDSITRPIQAGRQQLQITSSIGITLAPRDGRQYPDLLKNADLAMYRAKQNGRNGIQFYRQEMNIEMQRQLKVEQELRTALAEDQLTLYYQPIMDLESGQPVLLEALLRWQHPTQGMLLPHDFIDVAEQSGQLQAIGNWTIIHACAQCAEVQSASGGDRSIPISVNLSARQFIYPKLIDQVKSALEQTGLDARLLIIEIGEQSLIEHRSLAPSVIRELKNLGVQICVDHFGNDISSLSQLCKLPIDFIKIDQTFVRGVPLDKDDMTVTETLLGVARQIDIKTLVAGVESNDQEAFLRINGCQYAQGFLYSKALPGSDLLRFMASIPRKCRPSV